MAKKDNDELLSQEELGFLLTDFETEHEERDPSNDPWSSEDSDAVTLRGDLIDTPFTDVLQSVAEEEGVLRVMNPMEEHFLYLRSGSLQDLVVKRHIGRRVGQRLVAAGELEEAQLEEALRIHKRDGDALGRVLVSKGFADADLVAKHIQDQSVEDFYSLFTWSVGEYEYRPGPPAEVHREQFTELPRFEIDSVINEVAERRGGWDRILCSPEGLDGIIKPLRAAAVRLPAPHASIIRNLDGEKSLRELAETTMLGLFECARAVKDLYDWKMVESAEPAQLLTIARTRLEKGEPQRAAVILQSLWTRLDPTDHEFAGELADALQRCGENRVAARCLLLTAEHCELSQQALDFARKAQKADPRSVPVLKYLHERLLEGDAESKELFDVACSLTDALAREEKFEDALDVITPFAKPTHEAVIPFSRKVRLLCRLGSPQEAVSELLELADHYKEVGDRQREAGVVEHILRIDGDRKDLVARMAKLGAGKAGLRSKLVLAGCLVVAAALVGAIYLGGLTSARLQELTDRVAAHLDRGEAQKALEELDADREFLGDPVTDSLRARAVRILSQRTDSERSRRNKLLADFGRAAEHLDKGELEEALQIYGNHLAEKDEVLRVVQARFGNLSRRLEEVARLGERRIPGELGPLAKEKQLRAKIEQLDKDFADHTEQEARGVLAVRSDPVLLACLGDAKVEAMASWAERALELFQRAGLRKQQFLELLTSRIKKRVLEPLARKAEQYWEQHKYRDALSAYDELTREFPDKRSPVMVKFMAEQQRCRAIVEVLDTLDAHTAKGNSRASRALLRLLESRWPRQPWKKLVALPLWVESIPIGADVFVNGELRGNTQSRLLTTHRLDDRTHVEVRCDGFVTRGRTLEGHEDLLRVILPRAPDWEATAAGVVMARVRAHKESGQLLATDRSGTLTAFGRDGAKDWQQKPEGLNDWLPAPVMFGDAVVLASVDGSVRSFDRTSALLNWEVHGVPCQGAPVEVGGKLYAGTTDKRLVILDLANAGDLVQELALPGRVESDMVADGDQVFMTTDDGHMICVDSTTDSVAWKLRIGVGNAASPCVAGDVVVGASIEGLVLAVDRFTGEEKWPKHGLGTIEFAPALAGDLVFVAHENQLMSFRPSDGKRGPRHRGEAIWSVGPVAFGDRLLIGDRKGLVSVFEIESLRLLFTMQGKAAVTSISPTPLGVLVAFDDRTVQFFEEL